MALELTESFGGGDMERILGGDNKSQDHSHSLWQQCHLQRPRKGQYRNELMNLLYLCIYDQVRLSLG